MNNNDAFVFLDAIGIPVLSTANNGPAHKLVRLVDGREIAAESFETAISVLLPE